MYNGNTLQGYTLHEYVWHSDGLAHLLVLSWRINKKWKNGRGYGDSLFTISRKVHNTEFCSKTGGGVS